jgi:hypothetical protein
MENGIRKTFQFLIIFSLLVAGRASFGQTLKPGPQVLTFFSDVDDTEQPYGLYLPKNFNQAKKYPLVIMLHGAGSNHQLRHAHVRLFRIRIFSRQRIGEIRIEEDMPALPLEEKTALAQPPEMER